MDSKQVKKEIDSMYSDILKPKKEPVQPGFQRPAPNKLRQYLAKNRKPNKLQEMNREAMNRQPLKQRAEQPRGVNANTDRNKPAQRPV